MEHAEIIITTGGLGPTVDDPTREAVAKAVEVETEFREELWEQVSPPLQSMAANPQKIRSGKPPFLKVHSACSTPSVPPHLLSWKANEM